MNDGAAAWDRAYLAMDLLFADCPGLRGIVLKARAGPVRDIWLAALAERAGKLVRAHPMMPEEAFFGGVDVTASLGAGHIVKTSGLLAAADTVVLAMAERCPPALAARLTERIDADGPVVVMLDESADADEAVPAALTDRVALRVSLDGIGRLEAVPPAKSTLDATKGVDDGDALPALVQIAALLGVAGLRAPLFALRAARAHATLAGRRAVTEDDVQAATDLVLVPRATQMPEVPDPADHPSPSDAQPDEDLPSKDRDAAQSEIMVEAVLAALPDGLLDQQVRRASAKGAAGVGFGGMRQGNRRGRPLPARAGRPGDGARIDIVATLRAAVPWQALRGRGTSPRVEVRRDDLRIRRFQTLSDRVVIFAVDASGSAALNRLAEAKGAIELLLSQAYARRDHVALIAFRGTDAELLLPATRSLTQVKRRLSALPGGGGTPLAAGLRLAAQIARAERQRGLSPLIALLTDGKPNIALDGTSGRTQAAQDADQAAGQIAAAGIPAVVLDVSPRPNPTLAALSRKMDAQYVPLPHASAERMSDVLQQAMGDGLGA